MLAAARKYSRVVQVGTQRRSTPHLVDGARPHHPRGQARARSRTSRSTATTTCARARTRPTSRRRRISTTRSGPGPAPMRAYNKLVHPRGWRAFMEYSNGIVGDMCVHMLDMVRWMMDLGMPTRISSSGGILVDKAQQGEHHRHAGRRRSTSGNLQGRLDASLVGRSAGSEVPVGRHDLRRQGHAEGQRVRLRLHAARRRDSPIHADVRYELEQYPGRQDRKGSRAARRAGDPRAHEGPAASTSRRAASRWPTSSRATSRRRRASWRTCRRSSDGRSPGTTRAGMVVGDDEANALLRRAVSRALGASRRRRRVLTRSQLAMPHDERS